MDYSHLDIPLKYVLQKRIRLIHKLESICVIASDMVYKNLVYLP